MVSRTTNILRTYPTTTKGSDNGTAGTLRLRGGHTPLQEGKLTVTPVLVHSEDSVFGAEVTAIDWTQPIPLETVKQTGMDNDKHIAFSFQLGDKLETNPFYYGIENDRVGEPYLWDVGNIELDGSLVKPQSRRWHHSLGNCLWHTDSTYHQNRSKYSLLLSHGNPVQGGSWTHFADTRQAYADLPSEKKAQLEDMIVEHDLWHSRKLGSPLVYKTPTPEEKALKPPAFHKLVQPGPDGRPTLFIAAHAKQIVGMSEEESQKLIWELIDWCTQPKYVFSMEWQDGGDMVWWDNRQSMHRANPYTETMTARDVRRSTVIDDGPYAFGIAPDTGRST